MAAQPGLLLGLGGIQAGVGVHPAGSSTTLHPEISAKTSGEAIHKDVLEYAASSMVPKQGQGRCCVMQR